MVDGSASAGRIDSDRDNFLTSYSAKQYLQPYLGAYLRHASIRLFSLAQIGRLMSIASALTSTEINRATANTSRSNSLDTAERIAIFAHYSDDGQISESDAYFISSLREAGFSVVVSSTCTSDPLIHQAIWDQWNDRFDGLITRPNLGFDFGSWSAALLTINLDSEFLQQILLVNNSMYGPLFPLRPMIEELASRGDFFGLTASQEFSPHLQSYFLGFNRVVIASPAFRQFWGGKFGGRSKWSTIWAHELTWERFFVKRGFRSVVLVPETRNFPRNPLTFLWKELVAEGFPFIKKSLFTHNYDSIDMSDWDSYLRKECPDFDTRLIVAHTTG